MNRIVCIFAVIVSLFCIAPNPVFAADTVTLDEDITYLEDGSYVVTVTEEISTWSSRIKHQTKSITFYDSDDIKQWKILLTGMFTYDGTTSTCTDSVCTVTVYDTDKWYIVSETEKEDGNVASCTVVFGQKFLGITIGKPSYTVTITCDKDGNCT